MSERGGAPRERIEDGALRPPPRREPPELAPPERALVRFLGAVGGLIVVPMLFWVAGLLLAMMTGAGLESAFVVGGFGSMLGVFVWALYWIAQSLEQRSGRGGSARDRGE